MNRDYDSGSDCDCDECVREREHVRSDWTPPTVCVKGPHGPSRHYDIDFQGKKTFYEHIRDTECPEPYRTNQRAVERERRLRPPRHEPRRKCECCPERRRFHSPERLRKLEVEHRVRERAPPPDPRAHHPPQSRRVEECRNCGCPVQFEIVVEGFERLPAQVQAQTQRCLKISGRPKTPPRFKPEPERINAPPGFRYHEAQRQREPYRPHPMSYIEQERRCRGLSVPLEVLYDRNQEYGRDEGFSSCYGQRGDPSPKDRYFGAYAESNGRYQENGLRVDVPPIPRVPDPRGQGAYHNFEASPSPPRDQNTLQDYDRAPSGQKGGSVRLPAPKRVEESYFTEDELYFRRRDQDRRNRGRPTWTNWQPKPPSQPESHKIPTTPKSETSKLQPTIEEDIIKPSPHQLSLAEQHILAEELKRNSEHYPPILRSTQSSRTFLKQLSVVNTMKPKWEHFYSKVLKEEETVYTSTQKRREGVVQKKQDWKTGDTDDEYLTPNVDSDGSSWSSGSQEHRNPDDPTCTDPEHRNPENPKCPDPPPAPTQSTNTLGRVSITEVNLDGVRSDQALEEPTGSLTSKKQHNAHATGYETAVSTKTEYHDTAEVRETKKRLKKHNRLPKAEPGLVPDGFHPINYSESHTNVQNKAPVPPPPPPPPPETSWWTSLTSWTRTEAKEPALSVTPSGSSRASFAMGVEASSQIRAKSEETLRKLSVDYEAVVKGDGIPQVLDVQDSKLKANPSHDLLKRASQSGLVITKEATRTASGETSSEAQISAWQSNSREFLGNQPEGKEVRCEGCKLPIRNTDSANILNLRGRSWHARCFKCSVCSILLNRGNHFFVNGDILCVLHFAERTNVPRCKKCNAYILEPEYIYAKGTYWHKKHFQCGNCKGPIIDSKFVTMKDGDVLCLPCHKILFSRKCQTCGKSIKPAQQHIFLKEKGHYWHATPECLQCSTCHQSLVGRQRVFFKYGKPFCSVHCAQHHQQSA